MDTEVVEEAAVDGECDGDGPAAGDLVLDSVDVVGADGMPAGYGELLRFSQRCGIGLRPTVGRLTIMGKDVELCVPFSMKEIEGSVIGEALVLTTVELVPDEAAGKSRVLVRVTLTIGNFLDSGECLTDA